MSYNDDNKIKLHEPLNNFDVANLIMLLQKFYFDTGLRFFTPGKTEFSVLEAITIELQIELFQLQKHNEEEITEDVIASYVEAVEEELDQEEIDEIINSVWVGDTNYKEKLEQHRMDVSSTMLDRLQSSNATENFNKTLIEVMLALGFLIKKTDDTISAENVHFHSLGRYEWFIENGFVDGIWNATPGACDVCANKDGDEVNITLDNLPPEHPHCQCYITVEVDKNVPWE